MQAVLSCFDKQFTTPHKSWNKRWGWYICELWVFEMIRYLLARERTRWALRVPRVTIGFSCLKSIWLKGRSNSFRSRTDSFLVFFFSFSNSSTYTWEFLKPFSLCCNIMYFDMLRHLALINKDQTTVLRNYWRLQIKSNTGSFKPSFIALVLTTMDHKWLQDFRASLILVFKCSYTCKIPL